MNIIEINGKKVLVENGVVEDFGRLAITLELQDAVTQVELAFSRHMDKAAELFSDSVGFEQLRKFYKKAEMLKAQAAHELYHAVNVDGVLVIKNTFKV